VQKDLLRLKVTRAIISRIASGRYKDGDRLPSERRLCEEFSVSRGTLRQSLAQLEKAGAIKIKPGSGAFLQDFSFRKMPGRLMPVNSRNVTLDQIMAAREAIESAAVESASQKITKTELRRLQQLVERMNESVDELPEFLILDMEFHAALVKASRNEALIAAYDAISEFSRFSQIFSSSYDECERAAIDYHKKILAALQTRRTKQAVLAVKAHLEDVLASVDSLTNRTVCLKGPAAS